MYWYRVRCEQSQLEAVDSMPEIVCGCNIGSISVEYIHNNVILAS